MAGLTVTSLMPDQVFLDGTGVDVHEGIASGIGIFNGRYASGTVWIEHNMGREKSRFK